MKAFARVLVHCCVLLHLFGALQGRLFLAQNGIIYCKWSSRLTCNKFKPVCVQIGSGTALTCKHYKNECQYLIDQCLGKTGKMPIENLSK
ncbi:uncharacterized protein Dvir_GJ26404 [Drosophila virilis]|uniref:Kazal-like domain-containing protein n=1 Tax=Drosophila virilis TaxID=7244 RepID=A0A0Q9W407_DROVI|nr:uncharacterized protein Dvir_GJ26404 [Drosophila virilis]